MTRLARSVRRAGPLRVLYVVPDLEVGGAERHATTVLPALDRTRFSPSMVCIGTEGALFPALAKGGVPAYALHLSRREFPKALIALVREMRRTRPDIVITRGYNAELLGRVAAAIARVPRAIVWVRNCGDLTPRGRLRGVLDRMLDPVTSAYYGVAYGQMPYLTDDLRYPPSKITIIQNGADPSLHSFTPGEARDDAFAATFGIDPGDPVVGILAVLRPEKDHTSFLHAARRVLDVVPNARFLVVGDGPLRGTLEGLAETLGVADRVIFTGSRSDVGALLKLMDVFTLTSYTIECCPNALLEAMANGRPAVCTAVGGVPEMIEEGVTGYVVPTHDPAALAGHVIALLQDPARAKQMGIAARHRLETDFSIERSIRNAEIALETTAGRRTSTSCA